MKHYGDITKLNGHELPFVDVITGGSPCQDLSVAGNRAGLAGERSGLFMEQIRVVKELRDEFRQLRMRWADKSVRPVRYMVWENVVGALSSNGGTTSESSLKKQPKLKTRTPMFLDLTGNGQTQESYWVTDLAWLGVLQITNGGELHKEEDAYVYSLTSMDTPHQRYFLNCGEKPLTPKPSKLSWILEENPDPKYRLSARACNGILSRAERRGKELPPLLKSTLMAQSVSKSAPDVRGGQRNPHTA